VLTTDPLAELLTAGDKVDAVQITIGRKFLDFSEQLHASPDPGVRRSHV